MTIPHAMLTTQPAPTPPGPPGPPPPPEWVWLPVAVFPPEVQKRPYVPINPHRP